MPILSTLAAWLTLSAATAASTGPVYVHAEDRYTYSIGNRGGAPVTITFPGGDHVQLGPREQVTRPRIDTRKYRMFTVTVDEGAIRATVARFDAQIQGNLDEIENGLREEQHWHTPEGRAEREAKAIEGFLAESALMMIVTFAIADQLSNDYVGTEMDSEGNDVEIWTHNQGVQDTIQRLGGQATAGLVRKYQHMIDTPPNFESFYQEKRAAAEALRVEKAKYLEAVTRAKSEVPSAGAVIALRGMHFSKEETSPYFSVEVGVNALQTKPDSSWESPNKPPIASFHAGLAFPLSPEILLTHTTRPATLRLVATGGFERFTTRYNRGQGLLVDGDAQSSDAYIELAHYNVPVGASFRFYFTNVGFLDAGVQYNFDVGSTWRAAVPRDGIDLAVEKIQKVVPKPESDVASRISGQLGMNFLIPLTSDTGGHRPALTVGVSGKMGPPPRWASTATPLASFADGSAAELPNSVPVLVELRAQLGFSY